MPAASFAAGPYLFKDTMHLAAFNHNNFPLRHAAMVVKAGEVLCTDPYVTVAPDLLPLNEVTERSDLLVVDRPATDIWDVLGNGVRV